jgi:YidC/Oxa1 family membrane protein insertase
MDNRTLLAIVLSVVVVAGSFLVSNIFFPNKPAPAPTAAAPAPSAAPAPVAPKALEAPTGLVAQPQIAPRSVVVENNVMRVTFSNEGAVATSIELKKHLENGKPVQMVYSDKGSGAAFETAFGGFGSEAIKVPFEVTQLGQLSWKFSRVLADKNGAPFTLTKTFTMQPDEYLIKIEVGVASASGGLPVLGDADAYTLSYGPQLGPHFVNLTNGHDFRKYYRFNGNNRSEEGLNHETKSTDQSVKWAAISGKYFTVAGVPDSTAYKTVFSNKANAADVVIKDAEVSRLAFVRPAIKSSTSVDTFYFYVGPKEENTLKTYNDADKNGFGLSGMKLEQTMEDNWLLGWLEVILKWGLILFHSLIPNWGVAIILLTIVIKLATWPLTAKSYRANAAMQTLQPKMKELQEKYKDDPKKLNEQMMGLYQKEGVNPLGGCLPMLLQIPVFFALYSMFNTQFDLRGAMFIAGWIPDLSLPDSVWHWGTALPLVNWTDLRILPFVMVGTQIWTSTLSQPASGSTGQMKIMTYGLPFIFFFMLYEMPSGLMVYWCAQNILTVVQQWYINKHFKKVPAATGKPNLKLAPKKSGSKISK